MCELIKQGEREQAREVFTQAKGEYEKLLERVDVDVKTGAVTKSERATLLEHDAVLHDKFFDLHSDQQDLALAISKYEKCIQFRRAFSKSDPLLGSDPAATDKLQKVLDELKATASKTNGR